MRITFDRCKGVVVGYEMKLTRDETAAWAVEWPGSELGDKSLEVVVGSNGLAGVVCSLSVSNEEISACVSDHLPPIANHLWPTWRV